MLERKKKIQERFDFKDFKEQSGEEQCGRTGKVKQRVRRRRRESAVKTLC